MNEAVRTLSSSGPGWALIAAVLLLLVLVVGALIELLRRTFRSAEDERKLQRQDAKERQTEFSDFMKAATEAQRALTDNLRALRADSLAAVHDSQMNLRQSVQEMLAALHDKMFTSMRSGFDDLASSFDASLTGAATSIRKDQESLVKQLAADKLREEIDELKRENSELSRPHVIEPRDSTGAVPRAIR